MVEAVVVPTVPGIRKCWRKEKVIYMVLEARADVIKGSGFITVLLRDVRVVDRRFTSHQSSPPVTAVFSSTIDRPKEKEDIKRSLLEAKTGPATPFTN